MADSDLATRRLLARILRQGGGRLLDTAATRLAAAETEKPRFSLSRKLADAALLRIASRSVPGAIVVGGGLLARHLHRKRKARAAGQADENTGA